MRHVTYSDKAVLMGDEPAELLMEYAKVLGQRGETDTVTIKVIGPDGNQADATFLLNAGTVMMIETADSGLNEPENTEAIGQLRSRLDRLTGPSFRNSDPEPPARGDFEFG